MNRATSGKHLVIDGGTLIDGTGNPALENAVIVVEGERIKSMGKKGELPIPKGSRTHQRERQNYLTRIHRRPRTL